MKEFEVYIFMRDFINKNEVYKATEEILQLLEAEIAKKPNKTILNKSNIELKEFIAEGVSTFFSVKNDYIQNFLKGTEGTAIQCTISFDEITLNRLLDEACITLVECQNNLCNQALEAYALNENLMIYKEEFLKNTSIKDFIEKFMNTTVCNCFLSGGNIDEEIENFKTSIAFLFNVFCKMPRLDTYPLSRFILLCSASMENKLFLLNLKVLSEDVKCMGLIKNIARNAMFRLAFSELLNMEMDIDKIKLFFADPSVIFSINSLLDYKNPESIWRNLYECNIGALCKYFCKTQSLSQIVQQANNNLLSDEIIRCLNSLEANKHVDIFFEIIFCINVCKTQQEYQKAAQYKSVLDIFMKQENFRDIVVSLYSGVLSWKQLPIANDIPYISQDALLFIKNFSSFCLFTLPCLLINDDQKIISILNGDNSELRSDILFHINKINNFGQGKLFALLVEHNVVTFEDTHRWLLSDIKANYKNFSDAISTIKESDCETICNVFQFNKELLRSITPSNFSKTVKNIVKQEFELVEDEDATEHGYK